MCCFLESERIPACYFKGLAKAAAVIQSKEGSFLNTTVSCQWNSRNSKKLNHFWKKLHCVFTQPFLKKKKKKKAVPPYEKYPYQLLTSIKMHYIVFLSYGDKMQLKHLCNTDDWINMSMSVISVISISMMKNKRQGNKLVLPTSLNTVQTKEWKKVQSSSLT